MRLIFFTSYFFLVYANECPVIDIMDYYSGKGIKNLKTVNLNYRCMRKLDLANNNLITLPKGIFKKNFQELDVSNNDLNSIAPQAFEEFENGSDLVSLNLAWNDLKNPWTSLIYLGSLRTLVISGNPLGQLRSQDISFFENLDYLSAEKCNLSLIDFQSPLTKLNVLFLSRNSIQNISETTFLGVLNLEFLDLSFNRLQSLPKKGLQGLKHLKYLWLSNNKITSIENMLLEKESELKALYLNDNQLSSISPNAFRPFKSLEILNLRNNHLSTLNRNVFDAKAKIGSLFLWGNPLDCSCEKKINIKWALEHVGLIIAECFTPSDREGHSWTDTKAIKCSD